MRKFLLSAVCAMFSLVLSANDITPVIDVITRVAPWMENKVTVEKMEKSPTYADAFELTTHKGKLHIKATSIPAAGMGFNYYLKYYCHRNFALVGENLAPVHKLPAIKGKVVHTTTAEYRHIFNFCTQNYSASWWTPENWERTIDFMVLNGVNLGLATLGTEKIWYNTLKQFNFTEKEILDFIPGPAFNAWHMMGNMEGWGGPVTHGIIEKRAELEKFIVKRMREMEISPIYLSFYGMVPTPLKKKYPEAHIIEQGYWVGGFLRPYILSPLDPLYDKMADVYYSEVKKNYGEFDYFAGEPFHEGGIRDGIDAKKLATAVLKKIREYNPNAKWTLQSWSGNPTSEFLSGLSKEGDALIWDFRGELYAEWESRDGYEGYPFVWGAINCFGETPGLYGRLEQFVKEYFRAKKLYPDNMVGLGVSPEGILNNPVNFDLLFEIPWHDTQFTVQDWIKDYITFRYGKFNKSMLNVWNVLLNTAYTSETDSMYIEPISNALPAITQNPESAVCAPPAVKLYATSSWGTCFVFYDMDKMKELIPSLLKATNKLKKVDAFRYDLVNITRQLLVNEFKQYQLEFENSVETKDEEKFEKITQGMLNMLDDLDNLLSSRKEFMVGNWINAARNFGDTDYEKKLAEWNARAQITYWGGEIVHTDLRDYAHKEWAGLVKDVHKKRWETFFNETRQIVFEGKDIKRTHPTQIEMDWSHMNNDYASTPTTDEIEMAVMILNKLQEKAY